jgi:hypothetical protein
VRSLWPSVILCGQLRLLPSSARSVRQLFNARVLADVPNSLDRNSPPMLAGNDGSMTPPSSRAGVSNDLERRLETIEHHMEFEKQLRSLRNEIGAVRKRGAWQQTIGATLIALFTAGVTYWGSHERVELDGRISATNHDIKKLEQDHAQTVEKLRTQHERELATLRDTTENRRTDVEIFKQLTPHLISAKPDEAARALAIVGALDTPFWRPIAESFKLDAKQEKVVQQITKTRRDRYEGRRVACDRASHRTTDRLSEADQVEARRYCQTIEAVNHQGSDEPYKWPEGNGLTFNTGHTIGAESVWCSCAFRS